MAAVAAALGHAMQSMASEGMIPQITYPSPRVMQPTAKQRRALPSSVILTSPWAYPIAAAAHKVSGLCCMRSTE